MKAIGVTFSEQESINYCKNDKYSTLMNYLALYKEKIDDNTYICVILKDIQFGYKDYRKSAKRKELRKLLKQNHIKNVVKMIR